MRSWVLGTLSEDRARMEQGFGSTPSEKQRAGALAAFAEFTVLMALCSGCFRNLGKS